MKHLRACRNSHLLLGKGRVLLALILLTATTTCALAQATPAVPVQVATSVEPRKVTVGSPFRYTMRVITQSEVELVVPILADRIGDFLITDFGEVPHQPEGGKLTVERWYTLVTYEAGDKLVHGPAVQFRVPGSALQSVDAPDALVIVESLLPGDASKADVRDIKPPVAVPHDYRPLWWAAAALVLVAGAGFGLYRLLNRRRMVRVTPPRPAHEVALEALVRLRSSHLLEEGRHEDYYVRLSAIVRRYLEDRFGLRAPEMTTEEFLQVAQQSPRLPRDQRASLGRFLAEADLVKFARHVPEREEGERAYAAARQFVESTRPEAEVTRAAA
jgi:hypothetical protein